MVCFLGDWPWVKGRHVCKEKKSACVGTLTLFPPPLRSPHHGSPGRSSSFPVPLLLGLKCTGHGTSFSSHQADHHCSLHPLLRRHCIQLSLLSLVCAHPDETSQPLRSRFDLNNTFQSQTIRNCKVC